MEIINVIAAAAASFAFGAIWYMVLSRPWMEAAGLRAGPDGWPEGGGSPMPFVLTAVCMLVVAGMMRHIFQMAGIATIAAGVVAGLGIGAFFISPWIMMNNAYGLRPFKLTLIDAGYATIGCGLIGLVLVLF